MASDEIKVVIAAGRSTTVLASPAKLTEALYSVSTREAAHKQDGHLIHLPFDCELDSLDKQYVRGRVHVPAVVGMITI
jgi:hypothetical protein